MINGAEVLALAQSGQAKSDWRVWPARRGFFIKELLGYGFLAALAFGGGIYLGINPDVAYGPKILPEVLDENSFVIWRTIDFMVVSILFLWGAWQVVAKSKELSTFHSQMIILMPQGLVINKDNQSIRTVEYATIAKIQNRFNSGNLILKMDNLQTGKVEELELDGRFAHIKTLDKAIIEAYNAHHATHTQQPR